MSQSGEKDVLTDSGRKIGDPCEAIEAVFKYGPVTCMAPSVAIVTDAEWGTTHVACADHAGRVTSPAGMCHNGHPFVPGIDLDHPDEPHDDWCNTCGETSVLPPDDGCPDLWPTGEHLDPPTNCCTCVFPPEEGGTNE